jgi:hypothetical protein
MAHQRPGTWVAKKANFLKIKLAESLHRKPRSGKNGANKYEGLDEKGICPLPGSLLDT